ncbi:hypothetical protein I7I53_04178 [Histoplasma capsulatum var. duboisii H88]|uniref:Uncharacterized protein n=1 Tax=Ajellomyces capsulatus (strain H88) TaxID=544711 RepID=A0A8A1LQ72_AJEC8|nr:hypothetical protein I7I53_04178 [Histoplasma capsulatum var. duboisii H88]
MQTQEKCPCKHRTYPAAIIALYHERVVCPLIPRRTPTIFYLISSDFRNLTEHGEKQQRAPLPVPPGPWAEFLGRNSTADCLILSKSGSLWCDFPHPHHIPGGAQSNEAKLFASPFAVSCNMGPGSYAH